MTDEVYETIKQVFPDREINVKKQDGYTIYTVKQEEPEND